MSNCAFSVVAPFTDEPTNKVVMNIELNTIPESPGVYIFKGKSERILYVGKAKNLKNRLRSYFISQHLLDKRKLKMMDAVQDLQWIITDNELEALILECNLIKQHKPKYNVILRDDKRYPFLKITVNEQWPKIEVVRNIYEDGNLYFGPYVPSQSMWEALSVIKRHFLIRKCRHNIEKGQRPCIQYQMKRCLAPCAGFVSRQDYMRHVEDVVLFLNGKNKELLDRYTQKMNEYAELLMFEEAAYIRDKIERLKRALEQQKVISPELGDMDVIGLFISEEKGDAIFSVLFIRNGILIGAKDFTLKRLSTTNYEEVMESFLRDFYSNDTLPPPVILIQEYFDDYEVYQRLLGLKRNADVLIRTAHSSKESELINMAIENSKSHIRIDKDAIKLLEALKDKLMLKTVPTTIGAFDISTLGGSESSGGFVYWSGGDFRRQFYRKVRIKTVEGIDDYSMMQETIKRLIVKIPIEDIPNLIIIDGGKGHLEVGIKALADTGIDTEVVAVAKKPDRVFLKSGEVIDISDTSKSSLLLRAIRDEAHRFVITYHQNQRKRRVFASPLDTIKGIGKKRKLLLLKQFGSLQAIRDATVDEIAKIKGFNRALAETVLMSLSSGKEGDRKGIH
ncbi:MAG: excinuclease ABC subunit UvrC [Thermodesulfovibrionales bacterium]|nr:excinuclease ABC subunit UvrC [Thermodesulfovibrionales bacterium]